MYRLDKWELPNNNIPKRKNISELKIDLMTFCYCLRLFPTEYLTSISLVIYSSKLDICCSHNQMKFKFQINPWKFCKSLWFKVNNTDGRVEKNEILWMLLSRYFLTGKFIHAQAVLKYYTFSSFLCRAFKWFWHNSEILWSRRWRNFVPFEYGLELHEIWVQVGISVTFNQDLN